MTTALPNQASAHGFMFAAKYGASSDDPRCVARSDVAVRPDQKNSIPAHEYIDTEKTMALKVKFLAELLRKSKFTTTYAGAGLSRSAGIPDYATRAEGSAAPAVKKAGSSLDALPTYSHYAITALNKNKLMQYFIQQNHDGLPQKAGFPQEYVNEIHGAWQDPSNPVVQFSGSLRGDLFADLLEKEQMTDLCLCVGTTLSGMNADRTAETPAKKAKQSRALGLVIINLQRTRLDADSSLRIWGRTDDVFALLMKELGMHPILTQPFKLGPGELFQVPYDETGKLNFTVSMLLNLRKNSRVRIAVEGASNAGHEGIIVQHDAEGNWTILFDDGKRRIFGRWWVDAALRGAIEQLPIVNIGATIKMVTEIAPVIPMSAMIEPPAAEAPAAEAQPKIELVQSHRTLTEATDSNRHEWKLAIAPECQAHVRRARFVLHPTFAQPEPLLAPPFAIKRIGWGTFLVGCEIELKSGQLLKAAHQLTFSAEGDDVARSSAVA